ncbi:FecR family protein [Sphingobium chlorophenolicum]|uniref:Anti-FecI sigma factor, FecR n=1 Tax=Sphingobium chlorophenolicum TaxID=46429 RepID=A0A081RCF7_SPHCR|nr:FecR domain-containing protein [Sphingobium chlorophenolicum]KEQ52880.1 Anti-FecI sigma factor, FecR [Sphingobium chlorophenolicum]
MTHAEQQQGRIDTAAADWHAQLESPDMDWEAFGAWLDADPAHRVAYDAIALLDAEIEGRRDAITASLPANDVCDDQTTVGQRRRWWIGGGIATAAAIAILLMPKMATVPTETMVAYSTGPAQTQMIDLKDGSHILLDRNSRLALSDSQSPRIEMQSGTAYFDVRHDPSRAFLVQAGGYEIRDIGTKFDLAMTPQRLGVAVSEGKLMVAPKDGAGTLIVAGERIDVAAQTGEAQVSRIAAASVGSWRKGQLIYQATPLGLVANDLTRYVGRPVTADPSIGDLRVSGVLAISDGAGLIQQIEALLPVKAVETGGSIHLVGSNGR